MNDILNRKRLFAILLALVTSVLLFSSSCSNTDHSPDSDAEDYPVFGGLTWGDSAKTVLDRRDYRDKAHKWELIGAMENDRFFGFTKAGGLLYFDENETLRGCKYGPGAEGLVVEDAYESMKKALTQRYGAPDREDPPDVFADVRANNGTAGATWDNDAITVDLYETYSTFGDQDGEGVFCEIYIKDDAAAISFMGFSPGTPLEDVLSVWVDKVDGEFGIRSELRLLVPSEIVFDTNCEAVYSFYPYDGGKLRSIIFTLPNSGVAKDIADSYERIYREMTSEWGPSLFDLAEVGSEDFSDRLQNETDVSSLWDKDQTRTDNMQIWLQVMFSTERKDEPKKATMQLGYDTKTDATLKNGWLERITQAANSLQK
jgi:hypothetical protein